ncbi:MAG TPA: PQQ-binding-like beta-propeller repeat protein [Vicinamibacterales bacterium]|nr:PQQ-binding-like beta-propeller repeat protein [Vicinamibacterales bacterium]
MSFHRAVICACLLFSASSAVRVAAAENWPQWRGPGSQGISSETRLPVEWGPDRNIAWKTELPGGGHSSPVVWGDRIFVTGVVEGAAIPGQKAVTHMMEGKEWVHPDSVAADLKHSFRLLALDAQSGRILWERTPYEGPVFDARHRRSSFAGPTPVTDGTMVYAYFGPEGLYAYDFSGTLVWKVVEKFPTLGLGTGTSPVLFQDLVIIQRDEDLGENSAIVAYDKKTGREVWKARRNIEISWSTPLLVEVDGRTELVTNGNERIIAYDPATGAELWQTRGVESNAIHTPLAGHGLVIVTAGFPAKRVLAIRPGKVPDDQRIAWEYLKGTGYVLSNILYGDYLYLLTDNGIVTCLDPRTGAIAYEGGRVPVPARFMASPVAFAGFVAMTSEEGDTYMLKAGPEHQIVRTNSVDEPVLSSPAIANGRIYIRAQRHLFAIADLSRGDGSRQE